MKRCKDCATEGVATSRPAQWPGPRCHTHHRAVVQARKARAHARNVEAIYGISGAEYDVIYAYQGKVCAICERATGRTKRLAVDHDHDTGEVRGLLCTQCNYMLLGRYGVDALQRAIGYLQEPPARRALGESA